MTVKIEPSLEGATIITQPMIRDFSTGGGHGPGDTLIEGDGKIPTPKWQGFPPVDLAVIGKARPPLREVVEPRYRGTAVFATRVRLPNMLYARFLRCPYPHAAIRVLDTTLAEKMPGVAHVLTFRNALKTNPLHTELMMQGEIVAIVAADTEDRAEDAVEAIEIEYSDLPSIASIATAEAADAPDLREGKGNLLQPAPNHPNYHPQASGVWRHGDIEKGFAESDIVHEFTYYFGGGRVVPMQPFSGVAAWEGDKLTFWGHGQDIYPARRLLAAWLGIDANNIRYINKWNGGSFGGFGVSSISAFWGHIAQIARVTGRPVKAVLTKSEELYHVQHKPETFAKFKVGLTKDGRIHAFRHELHLIAGVMDRPPQQVMNESAKDSMFLYTARVPHWEQISYAYKSNTAAVGCARSCTQQELKWGFENLMDELSEIAGLDPVEFRVRNVARPGDKLYPALDWHAEMKKPELENGALVFDSFASIEVLEEGAKRFGWDKRNPKPGSMPGRFKRGMGLGMSQHHAGHMGYHEEEPAFHTEHGTIFSADVEMDPSGQVILRSALPDSGTNHDTGMATVIAEMLGVSDIDDIKLLWGDSDITPPSDHWYGGLTVAVQGGAALIAAKKLRNELFNRGARKFNVDAASLTLKDGVIRSKDNPQLSVAAADLVGGESLRMHGESKLTGHGRALVRGIGACFVEVEVDTWTGAFRVTRVVYSHDTGKLLCPFIGIADMEGSFMQSFQIATNAIPYDKEFPGQIHNTIAFLSFPIPTIMEFPDEIEQVFIESLEPRWFYGYKSFSETSIGGVPGAVANAIYNATGVRVNHPITAEGILMGLKQQQA
ncbi:MAG TPA: xanthine dehydrogenase family protein molybdopterin-binding subunit [Xanthobacteraceae bacterium]|jgi:CO/xanthine dehydrogenase Mo-binding subunit